MSSRCSAQIQVAMKNLTPTIKRKQATHQQIRVQPIDYHKLRRPLLRASQISRSSGAGRMVATLAGSRARARRQLLTHKSSSDRTIAGYTAEGICRLSFRPPPRQGPRRTLEQGPAARTGGRTKSRQAKG